MFVPLVDVVLCPKTESWSIKNQDLCAYAPSTNIERPASDIAVFAAVPMTVPVPPKSVVSTNVPAVVSSLVRI